MSVHETVSIIVRARREGVALFARADSKLGWKADRRPPDELLVALKQNKADIFALLPPAPSAPSVSPAVEKARRIVARLRSLGFRPRLDAEGALVIVDAYATGKKRRDVSQRLPIAEVFDTLVAGLADDPGLLDSHDKAGGNENDDDQ